MPKKLRLFYIVCSVILLSALGLSFISKYFLILFLIVVFVLEFLIVNIRKIEKLVTNKGTFGTLNKLQTLLYKLFE